MLNALVLNVYYEANPALRSKSAVKIMFFYSHISSF